MDINTVRELVTVFCFSVFVLIIFWAYSGKNKDGFDRAGRLPLEEDDDLAGEANGVVDGKLGGAVK